MSKRLHKWSVLRYTLHSLFFAFFFFNASNLWAQCSLASDVGGTVFRDLPAGDPSTANVYGQLDVNEPLMAGVIVRVTDVNGAVQLDTTDTSGAWYLSPAAFPVRVEFSWDDPYLQESWSGTTENTTLRIITAAACDVDLGVQYPEEYCQMVPEVLLSCYVGGDPLAGGSTAGIDAIVSFPYDRTGDVTSPDHDATMAQVGATWGIAYNRYQEEAYVAAVIKRHVGLGTQGIGGIYRIDYSGGTVAVSDFLDLDALGVDLGTEPTRILSANYDSPASDSLMFDQPGYIGIGDIDLTEDGNTLFIANLHSQKVVTVDLSHYNATGTMPTALDIDSLPALPDPACVNGESRLFALKYHRGALYAGVVCNGANGGTTANLSATVYVYDFNLGTWSTALSTFALDYTRGGVVDADCPNWMPWINVYDSPFINCRPSPMLSDIEFDVDGAMVLAFSDRYTFQKFTLQRDSSNANSESVVNGGDILRAVHNGTTYVLENNGTTIDGGGCGVNNQGPGTGEFYCGDFIGSEHSETVMGAAAFLPGSGKLLLTVINPVNYNSGGIRLFDNITGNSGTGDGYELYNTPGITFPAGNGFAVKGGGLGDVELMCSPAPIEVGNSVWMDTNGDGIRDADEIGIADVEVSLFDLSGNLLWLDTTDASGNFYFSDTLAANTDYYVAFGTDGAFDLVDSTFNDSLFLTLPNNAMGSNADLIDSDASLADGIHPAINGYPYIPVSTGTGGQNNHNLDIGFFACLTIDNPSSDESICSGDLLDSLQVSTNQMVGNSIAFVYFTSQQTGGDMYAGGTLLSYASPVDGLARVTDQSMPDNLTAAPIIYYVYAIANPTPTDISCRPFQEIQVTVNPASLLGMGSNTPICEPMDLNLTEGGGTATSWNWTGPNGFSDNNQNPSISMVTEVAQGWYHLTVTDANACTANDSIFVVVDTMPIVSLDPAGPFDDVDSPVNLTASHIGGMFSGTGITDVGLGTFDPSVAGPGTHTITFSFTDSKSCSNSAQTDIVVNGTSPIIGDFVWLDSDGDGVQDGGEPGIENVMVILYDDLNAPVDTAWTDDVGSYAFTGVAAGDYYLLVIASTNADGYLNLQATVDSVGTNDLDSDLNPLTGQTAIFSFDPVVSSAPTIDIGFYDCPVLLNPSTDQTICSGDLVTTLQVSTNIMDVNGVSFVYFNSPQTNANSYVGGLLLGNVTPFGGTATLSNVTFPSNFGTTPVDYYVYAVVNPTPGLGTCRPAQEMIVTVNPDVSANVNSNSPLCVGETLTLVENAGDATTWLWSGPNSFSSAIPAPAIAGVSMASGGRYYVTVTDGNGCADVDSVDVVINDAPSISLDGAGPFCETDAALNLTFSPGGGTFSGTGITDITLGTFDPSVASVGTNRVYYSITDGNGCTNTDSTDILVEAVPTVAISPAGPFCVNGPGFTLIANPSGGTFSGTGIIDNLLGIFNPVVSGVGTHTVTYTFSTGGCTEMTTIDIVVNDLPVVAINSAGPVCVDASSITLTGSPIGGTFSGTGITDGAAGTFDPATAGTGSHTITCNFTDGNGCTNSATTDIVVNDLPSLSLNAAGPFCESDAAQNLVAAPGGGTFSGTGITDAAMGTFDPAVATPGTYTITYTFTDGNACTNSTTTAITVAPDPTASIDPAGPFCANDGFTTLTGNPAGGTFSGMGITDGILGTFDPTNAGVGTHTITYTYNVGSCTDMATIDMVVNDLPGVSITAVGPFCVDASSTTLMASPLGGTFSGMGITDAAAGTFDPSIAGVGTHTINYNFTDGNACTNTASTDIIVNDLPTGSITAAGPFCESDAAVNLVANPSGGTFSGMGITDGILGTFDPATAGVGTHTISYSFVDGNACSNTISTDFVVETTPVASLNVAGPFCVNDGAATLLASPVGGTFSGVGITDGALGTFDPATAGVGMHTITYTYSVGGCSDLATTDIVVNDLPAVNLDAAGPLCVDAAAITLNGTPGGGTFSGTGITDAATGTFDPAIAGVGTHTISYSLTDGNGCTNMATTDVVVNDLPSLSITDPGALCSIDASLNLTANPSGGTFSGMGITDGALGTFDPVVAGIGTHTINYNFTDANGCANTTSIDMIVNDCSTILGDFVWWDMNNDGVQDPMETGLENVEVVLYDANTDLALDTVYSDNLGAFTFGGVPAGDYYFVFNASGNTSGLTLPVGSPTGNGTSSTDSDADPLTGQTLTFTYDPMVGDLTDIDAGFYAGGSIGDFVWLDVNADGIQDGMEIGLENVEVILYNANTDNPIDTIYSDNLGAYNFAPVPIGNYYLVFNTSLLSSTYSISPQDAGFNDAVDSDIDSNTGQSVDFTILSGTTESSIDAGFIPLANIGDMVWADTSENGLFEFGEPGIEGVTVTLYDAATDMVVLVTMTDAFGQFNFIAPAGAYYLGFDVSTNTDGFTYNGTLQAVGADETIDSDADPITGLTDPFVFDPLGGHLSTIDAGFIIDCPAAEAGPNVSICENTQAQLFASGGTTYNWTPTTGLSDPAIANPAAMPNTTTTYFVEVSDVFGCMSTDSVTVTVLPVPSITSILPTNPSFCGGADGSLVISAAGGITPLQFSIDGGMNFQASNSFSNLVAGTYQVVVANDGGSCPSAPMMATLSDNVVVCTDIIVADTMVLAAVDAPDLCFRLPFSAIGDYEISIDGAVYTDPVVACTIDTMGVAASQISLPGRGVYEMILTNTTTCCRDTVAIAVLSTTSPDTLFTITPFESSTGLLCADTSELAGDFSSISSCSAPQNGSFTFDGSPCVDYTPAMGFVGNDTLCLAVCDDFGSCDTTVMFITVLPETCPDIITATSETINLSDCSAVGALCIDLSLAEISSYNITDNGSPYAGGIQACDFDTSYVYTFFTLPGMGLTGPYTLDNWEVNGTAFSGAIPDMNALLDSMNLWDPMGNWTIDMGSSSILGGITASNYSTMTITEDASGTSTVLQRNISLIPIDTRLSFTLGGHEVVFMDASTGCSDTLNVNVVCACPTLFSGPVEIEASNCNDLETYCTPIAFADIVNYSISDNGGAYTGGVTPCPSDPSFAAIRVDTGFHQLVFTQLSSPCSDTLDLRVNCQACPDILPDALTLDAVDCDTPVEFCFDISPDEIADYTITDNGDPYTGLYSTCSFDTIQTYITIGFNVVNNYTLDSWTVNGANFSTNFISTQQLVDSMNVWDPLGNWEVSGLIISGGVNGSVYGNIIVSLSGITTADAVPNPQLTPSATSMTLDTGFHAIVISNDITGCVEMIDVTVNCAPIVNCSPLFTSQSIETSTNNCEDLTSICLPAAIEDIIRYSITDNGVPYTEPLEGCDFDSLFTYAYLTLPGAGNTGPYNLDSWTVNGTMFSGGFMNIAALVDSMNIWDVSSTWVFDPVDLIISGANPNNIYSSMNITQVGTGAFTSLDLNLQIRANATQIDLSTGSHLLRFTDNTTGCVDSISIDVLCIGTDVWTDTLMLGMIDTICVDTTELPGNIVSISNACPELSGDFVVFDVIENSNCIEVNAIDVGVDTACIVVCDDGGLCDTTLLYFTVLTDTVPPVAIADIDSTMQGQTVVINIQTNDGGQNIDTLFISGFPSNGVATLNEADGTITYAPNEGYCDSNTPDSLTYVVCNSFGCDSTTVSIYVFCNTINVMTGFSPNRDGKNDFFVIEGLQAYPNNVLNIYSRWGNLVYRKEGYLNDWDATWESTDLPDGTYFYVLSDGEGGVYSGYVQIHR